jgi:hypothetical protein
MLRENGAALQRIAAALQRIADAYDLRPLFVLARPGGCMPDFLRPPPSGPAAELDVELELIRATAAERVRAEVQTALLGQGRTAPDVERALLSPVAAERLADLLAAMRAGLFEPSWPRIRSCLERDILYRSRVLAGRGLATVLAGVAPSVTLGNGHRLARRGSTSRPADR